MDSRFVLSASWFVNCGAASLHISRNATVGTGMSYTLATAAEACGVYKSTILRAITAGKLSATKNEHGEWQLEPAEVHRVYPPATERTDAKQQYTPPDATTDALVAELRAVIANLRQDRDHWRTAFESAQRLLTPPPPPEPKPVSWWRWLRSTG